MQHRAHRQDNAFVLIGELGLARIETRGCRIGTEQDLRDVKGHGSGRTYIWPHERAFVNGTAYRWASHRHVKTTPT